MLPKLHISRKLELEVWPGLKLMYSDVVCGLLTCNLTTKPNVFLSGARALLFLMLECKLLLGLAG